MTTTIGMRDLVRNSNILDDYDYVYAENSSRKSHASSMEFLKESVVRSYSIYISEEFLGQKL